MPDKGYSGPLERVNDTLWRIPKRYKEGMRVDGLIYASHELMQSLKADQAPEQVANVAHLPGIQVASLAMPDIHWGYGFPIGGVAATDPEEGGVISPGGVGYDINCLAGDARVLHAHGYTRPIAQMADAWRTARLVCHNLSEARRDTTDVALWFSQAPRARVLRVVTETGDEVRATADHPFWTPDGMRPLGELQPGDRVALAPFEGVAYEPPSDDVIISDEDVRARLTSLGKGGGNGVQQALGSLKARGLLPLRASAAALPYLIKVLGFVFGDGTLRFENGNGKGVTAFYGEPADLEAIRADIIALGGTPSRLYRRQRRHHIQTPYAAYDFEREECHFQVVGTGFAALLACLGAPVGNKAQQVYDLPAWLDAAPLWQRRLFLAALFGVELMTPATITGHDATLAAPVLSVNKRGDAAAESGRAFLEHIARWLADFGVETQAILAREEGAPRDGERTVRLRLILASKSESLIALWGRVGFEYNTRRAGLAALAVQYLKRKARWLAQRAAVAEAAVALARQGGSRQEIVNALAGDHANERFIERSLYEGRATMPRIGDAFPSLAAFCQEASAGELSGMVWERIAAVEPVDDVDTVYDFTVAHADHNFIANGFVVSNCGVRLVRTNLTREDVAPRLKKLVNRLFEQIPTGVGRSGKYRFERGELRRLMADGVGYLKGRGLATDEDIAHTEAGGRLAGAEPKNVSDRALDRGAEQCGTLGSGNHFLEVQVVEEIFDAEAAEAMGLREGMVCVMIHSGSRGLGYQVCDDALHALRGAPQKYGIHLPDQQLACAPAHSPEGRHYIGAMRAAANFAWCNRQLLMWQTREVFAEVFGRTWQALDMALIYDVAHNIAKLEEHTIHGHVKPVWVHRKGATRAFPPGHPEVPAVYQAVGQPVIIPGDMGRASWVLVGQPGSMQQTFGTTCHGAGRAMSRTASVKQAEGRRIDEELEKAGVIARARSWKGLAEEQPLAYKNVDQVVDVVHRAGLSKEVARMRPIGVIKG